MLNNKHSLSYWTLDIAKEKEKNKNIGYIIYIALQINKDTWELINVVNKYTSKQVFCDWPITI